MQIVVVFTFWIIFSLLFQTVISPDFISAKIWVDLLFYLVVILGLRFNLFTGIIVTFLLGYLSDTVSVAPYGVATISYLVALLFIGKVKANIYIENRPALFFWLLVFSLIRQTVQMLVLLAEARNIHPNMSMLLANVLQAGLDALLGIFILPLLEKLLDTDWAEAFRKKGLRD